MGSPVPFAQIAQPDPMRRIIAGLRQSSQPGTINQQVGDEMSFYGQGDPFDIAVAEEQRRTERARADQRLALSDASWVDPRLERDDPTQAAKIRQSGADLAARTTPIQDGPLAQLLEGSRGAARVMPMMRGAERVENIADANAEATNYGSAPQVGMRGIKRGEGLLDAQQAASTFMDPQVTTARRAGQQEQIDASLAAGRDPRTRGFEILGAYLAQLAGNPYPTAQVPGLTELAQLFQIPTNGMPTVSGGDAATTGQAQSNVMSSQEVVDEATRLNLDPKRYADELKRDGVIIRP